MTTTVRKRASGLDRLFRGARFNMPDGFAGGGGASAGGAQAPAAPAAPANAPLPSQGINPSGDGEVYTGLGGTGDGQQGNAPVPGQAPGAWPDDVRRFGIENPEQLQTMASRASMYEAQQELIQQLMDVNKQWAGQGGQGGAPGQAPGGQPAERQFIGPGGVFPSQAAANAAFQADPNYYYRQMAQWGASIQGGQPGGRDQALAGEVRQMKQSMLQQSWNSSLSRMMEQYPHLKDAAVQQKVDPFIGQHAGWARSVQEHRPEVPIAEILVKAGDYDRVVSELAALKGRMGEVRGSAGVARTSVGGATAPLAPPRTHAEAIQRVAAQFRSKWGQEPPGLDNYMGVAGRVA